MDVRYILKDEGLRYDVYSPAKKITAHILLPKGKTCAKLWVDGHERAFEACAVGDSQYVDFVLNDLQSGKVSIQIEFVK